MFLALFVNSWFRACNALLEIYFLIQPCRDTEEEYLQQQEKLSKHLMELISESLGLNPSCLNDFFGEDYQQTFLVNHYPPHPDPTCTVGIQKHSDFSGLTILMQNVEGLQFLKDGEWVMAKVIPDAYVINLGDQIEVRLQA